MAPTRCVCVCVCVCVCLCVYLWCVDRVLALHGMHCPPHSARQHNGSEPVRFDVLSARSTARKVRLLCVHAVFCTYFCVCACSLYLRSFNMPHHRLYPGELWTGEMTLRAFDYYWQTPIFERGGGPFVPPKVSREAV